MERERISEHETADVNVHEMPRDQRAVILWMTLLRNETSPPANVSRNSSLLR
jgi:hypothetical protein